MKNFENKAIEQQEPVECNQCGGTGDVSGEYPGVACPDCNGSGFKAQPDFTKHEVEQPHDWSEWVCPDPESYLMKCCDCGLVHEAQFKVVRYKFETEREDCEPVDDPNVQAVFRMRRSEQWSPDDTAHRAGGLPMDDEPAEQQEPVAWMFQHEETGRTMCVDAQQVEWGFEKGNPRLKKIAPLYTSPPKREWQGLTDEEIEASKPPLSNDAVVWELAVEWAQSQLKEKNT